MKIVVRLFSMMTEDDIWWRRAEKASRYVRPNLFVFVVFVSISATAAREREREEGERRRGDTVKEGSTPNRNVDVASTSISISRFAHTAWLSQVSRALCST